jgi:hypothetical protein
VRGIHLRPRHSCCAILDLEPNFLPAVFVYFYAYQFIMSSKAASVLGETISFLSRASLAVRLSGLPHLMPSSLNDGPSTLGY